MEVKQILKKIPTGKKAVTVGLIILICALVAGGFVWLTVRQHRMDQASTPLTQEQLVKLIKPSVVRIIQHEKGTLSIPDFDIDLETFSILPTSTKPTEANIDEYISGSGSIITPDGYIVTNSHVVSKKTLVQDMVLKAAQDAVDQKTADLSTDDYAHYFPDDQTYQDLVYKAAQYLYENSSLKAEQEITVLNPGINKRHLQDILDAGFPASIISVNDDFSLDQRDAAVIKINQANLPSLTLSTDNNVSVGDKIYVFGFPATAEFNDQNFSESTLTSGVVSATKFNDDKNFKVYQTDAKISEGSSGGPMFNDQGQVIGLVTFETGLQARQAGDNFAFAIPISIVNDILAKKNITNIAGDYSQHLRRALDYINRNECKAAENELAIAKTSNKFFATEQYVKPYVDQCQSLIDGGRSLDTAWAKYIAQLKTISALAWFVVIGRIILALMVGWIFWLLIERIHADEREITKLEQEIDEVAPAPKTLTSFNTPLPLPEEGVYHFSEGKMPLPHPDLVSYIQEARAVGMHDNVIVEDLQKAGWNDSEIDSAFKKI